MSAAVLSFSSDSGRRLVESGLHVVVTGGGGWLGQATVEMLESSLGEQTATRVHVFASSRRSMQLRSGLRLEVYPLSELPERTVGPHLLAHYAFATREYVSELGTTEYIARNVAITDLVAAHVRRSGPVGMLVLSSGAVYSGDELETNPYGVLKVRDERLFSELAAASTSGGSSPRLVVPRLFNLAGPFLIKPRGFALGSILSDIKAGGPIELRADHPVVRSYVHVRDLVDLSFAMMLGDGPLPLDPFDTAGEREIEVGELAELAATVLGYPDMPIVRPPLDEANVDRYVGDPSVIGSLARAYGIEMSLLPEQIEDTARYLGI